MFIPPSNVDTLYDYIPLLEKERLCEIPVHKIGQEVAVIGSGASGMLAAFELLKMGFKPVIYEACDRMGGRLYSKRFETIEGIDQPFAEMGAMRIPPSSRIFLHYAEKLGLKSNRVFPSAGKVNTTIYYQDKIYQWEKNQQPPEPFATIRYLWNLFIEPMVERIHQEWQVGNIQNVRQIWQMCIDQYKYMSFYEVLKERSPLNLTQHINILGALGIGHGGFSPIFQVSFLEILRILVNQYMADNLMIAEGVSEFVNRLYHLKAKSPLGEISLADLNSIHFNSPIVLFDYNNSTKNPIIITKDSKGDYCRIEYPAVIFTGTISAANLINVTNRTESGIYLFDPKVRNAIKVSPMLAFSKTYICTKEKFWLKTGLPSFILTDDVTRLSCFLDYPLTKYGVICLSYAWGMAATKLHAVDPKDRVKIFKRALTAIYPELDKYLVPLNDEVLNVDWINVKYQNGAFKIFTPGYDACQNDLYFQFLSSLKPEDDKGVYLAGDSVSWSGGWVEGALYTSLNAVYAVAKHLGAKIPKDSPLSQDPHLYNY